MPVHEIQMLGDRSWYDVTATTAIADPLSLGFDQYVEGTRTHDNLRIGGHMPYRVEFTDRANVKHRITIESQSDQYTTCFPCGTEIIWHAKSRDRTGLDAQTQLAMVTFGFVGGDWFNSPGIRVAVMGYKSSRMGEAAVDTKRWQDACEMMKTASEGVKNLADAYATVATAGAKPSTS